MLIKAGVTRSQATIQNRLKGNPSTRGVTRSQRAAEKHIPQKGINANKIETTDGLWVTQRR